MTLKNEYEVIIVGYGPLGQLCGLLLSKSGVKIAIIERKKDINPLPRSSVVDGQSLRFTNLINIYSEIKDLFNFCDEKKINIKKVIGVNENQTSIIKKSNLEIKNLFSKVGIFLIG